MNHSLFWFGFIFFWLLFEMGHPGLLYFLAFSVGSFCSWIVSFYSYDFFMQGLCFCITSSITLYCIYQMLTHRKQTLPSVYYRSNLDALIGMKVRVFSSATNVQIWQTKISGQVWMVQCVHHEMLYEGQEVIIIGVQGCHLKVDIIR